MNDKTTTPAFKKFLDQEDVAKPDKDALDGPSDSDDPEGYYHPWFRIHGNRREPRFEVRDRQNEIDYVVAFSDTRPVILLRPNLLILICTHFTLVFKGRKLETLKDMIRREDISYVQSFNKRHFEELADEEKDERGFIESIDVVYGQADLGKIIKSDNKREKPKLKEVSS